MGSPGGVVHGLGVNVLSTNDCVHTGGIVPRQNSSNSRSPEWNLGCVEDDTNIEHRTWSWLTSERVLFNLTSTWKKKKKKKGEKARKLKGAVSRLSGSVH